MRDFALRSHETEDMEAPDVRPQDLEDCLVDLAKANTFTLARPPTLHWLAQATKDLPRGAAFTLLDVGYGQGDMLRVIHRWAVRHGLKPRLAGIDLTAESATAAEAATPADMGIRYLTGDVFDYRPVEPLDFVISSLVTHHMTDDQIVGFLRWMEATTRRGWFVNDLHRHPLAYYGFWALSNAARWHPMVRHDGLISVARSFRREDWEGFLAEAGVPGEIDWVFPFRICVGHIK